MSIRDMKEVSVKDLFLKLASTENGLSTSEAKERLDKYGYNEIPEKKINPFLKFLKYFWGPIPWMIEIAAILSAYIRHWEDVWIITALLLLNAVVGFWQEKKADNAIELLKQKLALKARVLRDGNWQEASARELVPGDVIRIRLGDIVPADAKLVKGDYLQVDESALTGESLPVEKATSDVTYAGSIIRQGEMDALVAATGANSYFGKTAKLVEGAQQHSQFQKAVIKIGDFLIILAVSLVTVVFLVALVRHESILDTLQFALVLTVAAIPVALPAVLTVTMAVGATALAKKEAIVSKLVAIEEMAGMDILCADKTGTITKNELTVAEVKPFPGFKADDVLLIGSLASRKEDQDPIDSAVISKTEMAAEATARLRSLTISAFHPFDPVAKRTEANVVSQQGERFKVSKGAPQVILSLVENKESIGPEVDQQVNLLATHGYRALGVARTDSEGKWQFAGLIPLYDPPRDDSAITIKTARSMGVDVKMVTGDHLAIAKEISSQMELGTNILRAPDILNKPDNEALQAIENADGFAEVFPEHKYRIVELLQHGNHIVGMTGDGVNDAPALKEADAGIAVAGATDAAKSAADIVLTKPGLSVIIDAIKESRKIFQRMDNYSIYRITETIRVLIFITLSIIIFGFYPVTALMIVLLALLNDAPIMTIAYDNVRYSNEPEKWNMKQTLGISAFLGLVGVISSFLILYIGLQVFRLTPEVLQSFIYLKLSVAGHLTVFVARTKKSFWSIRPSIQLFLAVVVTQTIATILTVYGILLPAMGWGLALFVWGYALVAFLITDFAKLHVYRFLNRKHPSVQ
ncbi:MAG: plasma-membrane proton-efflux P-type ATPase [Candidatus Bathyarchaeia archaeon]